ncbi:MAG: hypothetical protein E3K36_11240 [Candidatus Brocadia sp.]|nr:hypothetical protein [Candidatus Brocadia sp.]
MDLNKKIVFRSIFIVFIIFSLLYGIYLFIPFFLEKKLLPRLAKNFGLNNFTCDVRKFSLTGLDLSSLQWGESESPSLSFDSVRFDYSLFGLLQKHVNKIIISGVEIRSEYKDGTLSIPGMDFKKFFQSPSDTKQEKPTDSQQQMLPVSFGEFALRNATILLKSGDENFRIPLSIKAKPFATQGNETDSGYEVQLWLYPNLANPLPGVKIASRIAMDARYNFKTNDFGIQLNFTDMNIEYKGLQIQNSPGNAPLTIEVTKKQGDIHMKFSRFCIMSPFPIELSMRQNTDCNLHISPDQMNMQGKIYVNINKELANSNSRFWLKVADSESLPFTFKGKKGGSQWYFSLNSTGSNTPLQFHGQTGKVRLHPKLFSVYGKGKGSNGTMRFSMKMSHIKYDSDYMRINIPNFWIFGNSSIDSAQFSTIKAFAKVINTEYHTGSLSVRKIHAKIPFQWPYPSMETDKMKFINEPGRYFNTGEIKYADMDVGRISATPYQDGLNIFFAGQHKGLFPDFHVHFLGSAGMSNEGNFVSILDFKTSEPEQVKKIDLGKFSSRLTGMFFEGNLAMNGNCKFIGSTITSNALIAMHNSKIEVPGKKMTLEGIDLDLDMQDLYKFCSAPDQMLKFKRFAWGDVEMNGGEVEFQIESFSSFFLKKSGFSWCGGHVYTHGLRIKSGRREFDLICYCDRLKLATILKQFKAASADGEGAVNGRIPISYKEGKIKVHDGFLYSTPGEKGTISFRTDTLVSGTSGVQQSIQMQIAQEALKNFQYDWAKLSLMSQGDDLMVRMQMDGRPADLLPFGFSKAKGLVKIEEPRAHFQGIRFNINFKLPLDKMLYYGAGMSELLHSE